MFGILKSTFKSNLVQNFGTIKGIRCPSCAHCYTWKRNLDSYKKGLKTTEIKREEISRRNSRVLPLFDQKSNEENLDDLKIEPSGEKLRRYKSNWLRHVTLMNKNEWLPKLMLNYAPNGRSRLGRPLKKVLVEVETGLSRPNL